MCCRRFYIVPFSKGFYVAPKEFFQFDIVFFGAIQNHLQHIVHQSEELSNDAQNLLIQSVLLVHVFMVQSQVQFNRHVMDRNMSMKEQTAKQALVFLLANSDVCMSSIRYLDWSSFLSP